MLPARYMRRFLTRFLVVVGILWLCVLIYATFETEVNTVQKLPNDVVEMKMEQRKDIEPNNVKVSNIMKHYSSNIIPVQTDRHTPEKLKEPSLAKIKNLAEGKTENVIEARVVEKKEIVADEKDKKAEVVAAAELNGEDADSVVKQKQGEHQNAQLQAPKELGESGVEKAGPGEMGAAVVIDPKTLTEEQRKDYDKGWQDNAFNRYASDMISLHRSLPDVRPAQCKQLTYPKDLPSTCVIIIFHNEAWSVLLRTVHSVIDRSNPNYLKEVILVDDASYFDHLKEPLQNYVNKLKKVTLHRSPERIGLIRARLLGFKHCTAEVSIFLDSHCEATEGWFDPLLARIFENETNVAVPVLDILSDETFKLTPLEETQLLAGGFTWQLEFTWLVIPKTENIHRNYNLIRPFRSPTMAGGLFAISSEFFRRLGTYDDGFDIWGGENLELSFKTWMCGGTLETIPCSHVGHVFRKRSPYKWGNTNVLRRNLVRLAEVWLDDFKEYYYMRIGHDLGEYGDVSERKAIRERLQCKSFRWYLNNVYPEMFVPGDSKANGEIRNMDRAICADANTDLESERNKGVSVFPCHGQGGNQFWLLSLKDEIRRDDYCWDGGYGDVIRLTSCHGERGNQEFKYEEDNTIRVRGMCVELTWDAKALRVVPCTGVKRQHWEIKRGPPKGPASFT